MTKPASAPSDSPQPPAEPPAKRRTRGPNKPKPASLLEVRVDATMSQSAIAQVLADYVAQEQDWDTAVEMELQINTSSGAPVWVPVLTSAASDPQVIRFATKGSR